MAISWKDVHAYQRLASDNLVPPLTCDQGHEIITRLGKYDEVVFHCLVCETRSIPGLRVRKDINAALNAHK